MRSLDVVAGVVAWGAAAVVLWIGLTYGTRAAGGADVYGYVSQVPLWLEGRLHLPQPLAATAPWPNAAETLAPLGYRPGRDHTIVPTYAPGIPLLMCALVAIFGTGAEYWLTPMCAALLVGATFALGSRLSGPVVGAVAAICIATSPLVLHMTCWLLADLPAATFWTLSLWLSLRPTAASAAGAGLAAAVGILIRPNLVPLAVVPLILTLCAPEGRAGRRTRVIAYAAAASPAPLFIAWLFNELYGSPLRSGYGETRALYSAAFVWENVQRYTSWILATQGPVFFLFPLSVGVAARRGDVGVRALLTAFVMLVWAAYAAYQPFDAWWYLRFFLPAFPVVFVLCADVAWNASTRPVVRNLAMAFVLAALAGWGVWQTLSRAEVLSVGIAGDKYADVGEHVRASVPRNAVVYAMQHSSTVRHYADLVTVRWELLEPSWLQRSIEYWKAIGYEPYVLLDEWEIPQFRERFAGTAIERLIADPPGWRPSLHDTVLLRVSPPTMERIPKTPRR